MGTGLLIVSWDGHTEINDGTTYSADFVDGDTLDTLSATGVETERPGTTPVAVRSQPDGVRFNLEVTIEGAISQTKLDQLKQWFSPLGGERYLVATDEYGDGADRRILCSVERLLAKPGGQGGGTSVNIFNATLRAVSGVWESADAPTPDIENIVASGHTWIETNAGSTRVPVVFTVTPNAAKTGSWLYRRQLTAASRTEVKAMDDPIGDGYPLELAEGNLDTDALQGGGKVLASLDDLRVISKDREQNRWPSPATDDPLTKLWTNASIPTMKTAVLAADIDGMATALEVTGDSSLAGWIEGHLIIDTEVIQYSDIAGVSIATLIRGARNTNAAAHSAGATIFWVGYTADVIYGNAAADAPPAPLARKPVIDLAASSNILQVRTGPFYNAADRRSGAFQRIRIADGTSVLHLRSYDDTGDSALVFEDLLSEAGKPNANNAVLDFPVPFTSLTLDYDVGASLLLQAFVLDVDGNESRLITAYGNQVPLTAQEFDSLHPLTRLRLNARIAAIYGDLNIASFINSINVAAETKNIGWETDITTVLNETVNITGISSVIYPAIHFNLAAETAIEGFIIGSSGNGVGNAEAFLYSGDGGQNLVEIMPLIWTDVLGPPDHLITMLVAENNILGNADLVLPGGDYWIVFTASPFDYLKHTLRTHASLWGGKQVHLMPPYVLDPVNADARVNVDAAFLHQPDFSFSPVFGVISRTEDPQADAPTNTGNAIRLKNIITPLDETRAPLILMAGEEPLYLADFILANDDTGDFIHIFHPLTLGDAIEIDTEARTVREVSTGLPLLSAVVESSAEWPELEPGANTLSFTEPDVTNTDVTSTWRDRFL